ncbi:hypothetical protein [Methylobacterium oryzisoli]|uniref:hypothetical protein n=1 Tax=Methylobacterium oryzisoli TaxID=3385502 RepID=UPI00389181AB
MVDSMGSSVCSQPVVVNTGDGGQDGLLVFVAKQLVAVLVLLEGRHNLDTSLHGKWFLEAGFGPCQDWNKGQIFTTREEAIVWIQDQVLIDGGGI